MIHKIISDLSKYNINLYNKLACILVQNWLIHILKIINAFSQVDAFLMLEVLH